MMRRAAGLLALLPASGAAVPLAVACGSTPAPAHSTDSGAPDSAAAIDGWAPESGTIEGFDAGLPNSAPCVDDAGASEVGVPFTCSWPGQSGGPTCWSGSQVCVLWSVGQIRHLYPGNPGCESAACSCGSAVPSCACLDLAATAPCRCSDDGGAVVVTCVAG